MTSKLKTLYLVLLAVLMAACSGSDRGGDIRSDLLGFVPDKTPVVISMNPQKLLQSAGGDWTENDGIVLGPYIEDCIKQFGQDFKDIEPKISQYLKIQGLNPQSFIIATNNNFRSWYLLGAISDKGRLSEYLSKTAPDMKFKTIGDFEVADDGSTFLLLDNADALVWVINDRDADGAVKTVKTLKSRASDKAMPKWTHEYLGSGDNCFGALGNFGAMGVNLTGLMRMMNVPADLLGGEISYLAFTAKDQDHKASCNLLTLDDDGASVPLLNEKIYKSADLSAWNMLPRGCSSKAVLGIRGEEIFEYLPMLRQAIGDATISEAIASLQSIAFGVGSVDYSAFDAAMYGANAMTEFPIKNAALIIKCAPGKSDQLMNLIATAVPGAGVQTVDANTLKLDVAEAGIKGLEAVYFSNQNGAVVVSTDNVKAGNSSESLPSGTLAYSYADSKVYGGSGQFAFATEMFKSGTGRWDADGMHSEVEFTDKCPGALAFISKFVSVYAAEMMKAQEAQKSLYGDSLDIDDDFVIAEELDEFVE